jgi:hypothetical protein
LIVVDGRSWGTAQEIADHLGNGVTHHTVRWWARNNGLTAVRLPGPDGRPQVRHPLDEAIQIEARKTVEKRGRPRSE